MKCPECGSKELKQHDWLIYHTDGRDYKCQNCDCEFGIFVEGFQKMIGLSQEAIKQIIKRLQEIHK